MTEGLFFGDRDQLSGYYTSRIKVHPLKALAYRVTLGTKRRASAKARDTKRAVALLKRLGL